jgi:hypothetical protein
MKIKVNNVPQTTILSELDPGDVFKIIQENTKYNNNDIFLFIESNFYPECIIFNLTNNESFTEPNMSLVVQTIPNVHLVIE